MAKSRTKRKNNQVSQQQIEQVVNAAASYIQHWTQITARDLLKEEVLIIPTSWGFRVGRYSVRNHNFSWRVENSAGEHVNTFISKRSAVTWSVLHQTNRFKISERIWDQDRRLSKLTQDSVNYKYNQSKAIKRQDYVAFDVVSARLKETESLLEHAKIDLEKTLNSAKYIKGIWEKPL